MRSVTIFICILLFAASVSAAKMYKWVDAEGNVTFSQIPPPSESSIKKENIEISEKKSLKPHKRGKRLYCGKSVLPGISERPESAIFMLEERILSWTEQNINTKERRNEYAHKNSHNSDKLSFIKRFETYHVRINETNCKIEWAKTELHHLDGERAKILKNHDDIVIALQELESKKISTCGPNNYSGIVVLDDEAREYFKCERRFDKQISVMKRKLRKAKKSVKIIDY